MSVLIGCCLSPLLHNGQFCWAVLLFWAALWPGECLELFPPLFLERGILIRQEGMFDVVALGSGQLAELLVDLDDPVEEGQVVARISQLELKNKIVDMRALLKHWKPNKRPSPSLARNLMPRNLSI